MHERAHPNGEAAVFEGQAEVDTAARAIAAYLHEPDAAIDTFVQVLTSTLNSKFQKHWWPATPSRGEGYRHLNCGYEQVDPAIAHALRVAGIPMSRLPRDMSVWCDPGSVTTRVGSRPLTTVLVGTGQSTTTSGLWTPPVSPSSDRALSARAAEFKPSPPSSPKSSTRRWHAPPGLDSHKAKTEYALGPMPSPPYGASFGGFPITDQHQQSMYYQQQPDSQIHHSHHHNHHGGHHILTPL